MDGWWVTTKCSCLRLTHQVARDDDHDRMHPHVCHIRQDKTLFTPSKGLERWMWQEMKLVLILWGTARPISMWHRPDIFWEFGIPSKEVGGGADEGSKQAGEQRACWTRREAPRCIGCTACPRNVQKVVFMDQNPRTPVVSHTHNIIA